MARKQLKKRVRQVDAESRLRFGGQRRQLKAAVRDVDEAYANDVRVANQTARGAKRSARAAAPVLDKAFSAALATTEAGPTPGESAQLGALGPAAARDSENTRRRLAETLAGAQAELGQRQIDAEAGRSSAVRQAAGTRTAERKSLRAQLAGIAGDSGTFRQARLGELGEEAKDRRVTKRGQDITKRGQDITADQRAADRAARERQASADRAAAKERDAAKDKEKSKPKATGPQRQSAQSAIALARQQAQRLKAAGRGRGEIGPLLVEGRESQTLDDPDNPGQKIKVPGVKKVEQLWASVALDIEFDGELSQANLKRMRKLGYGAQALELAKYKPKPKKAVRRDGNKAKNRSPGGDVNQ